MAGSDPNEDLSWLPDQSDSGPAAQGAPRPANQDDVLELPDQTSKTEQNYYSLSGQDPDKIAPVVSMVQKTGEDPKFVQNNLPALQKAQAAPPSSFFDELEKNYPGTVEHLSDPNVMAVTHDDLPNLAAHEGLIDKFKDALGFMKDATETGALQEELAFLRFGQMSNGNQVDSDPFRIGSGVADSERFSTDSATTRIKQINDRLAELASTAPTSQDGWVKRGLYGIGTFAPMAAGMGIKAAEFGLPAAAAGAAVSGIGALPAAAIGGEAGVAAYNYKLFTGMSLSSLDQVRDVNNNPLPENVKEIAAVSMGVAQAGLGFAKLGALLDTIPGGKDFLSKFTAQAGEKVLSNPTTYATALKNFAGTWVKSTAEGVGAMEAITGVGIAGTEAAKAASGQTFTPTKLNDIATQLGNTASDAGPMFALMGLPGVSLGLTSDLMEARQTQANKAFYTAMGDTAEASKLRQRLPESHQEFIQNLTKDSPVENVYLDPKALTSYFQSKGIDTDTAMSELGATKAMDEALATGEKVKIPLADWVDKMVGTEHYKALENDVTFDPNSMSVNEYNQKREEIRSQAEAAANAPVSNEQSEIEPNNKLNEGVARAPATENEATENQDQIKASGQKVYNEVSNLLQASGLSEKEVALNPKLQEAFFRTLGQNLGQDPYELFKQYPLSVNGVEAGFEKSQLPDLGQITSEHIATPEAAIKNIGTRERAESLEAQLREKGISAQERIDASGGRAKAAPKDLRALQEAGEAIGKVRAVKDRLPREQEFNQTKIADEGEVKTLNQQPEEGEGNRGKVQIAGNRFNIQFLEHADKSTFLHETGHTFLDVMGKAATSLEGKDDLTSTQMRVMNDSKTLLNWLGVNSWSEVGTAQHEKFAEGFEKYLAEGRAPSEGLQTAFATFKKWLVSIYRSLKNIYPDVPLTDEVRGVMDRMLATDDEISRAQEQIGYKDEVPGKLAPKDAAPIEEMQARARALAEETLLKEQMPETTKEHAAFLESERARLTEIAKGEVAKDPLFAAADEIKSHTGDPTETAGKFLDGRMRGESETRFETTAANHDFEDGKDLATKLKSAGETNLRDQLVNERVEAGMAPHANLMDTDAIKAKAMEAIHNEKSGELLALESQALSKMARATPEYKADLAGRKRIEARVEAQFARESARSILGDKPIKESTKASTYITAERNAAVRVSKALAAKDFESAAKAKREQLLNHSLAAEAMRNKLEVDRKLDYLNSFSDRGRNLKDMPYGFVRAIDDILARFGIKSREPEDLATQTAMANSMLDAHESPSDIANATGLTIDPTTGKFVPESLPSLVKRVNENYYALSLPDSLSDPNQREPQDLKLAELRDLYDGVKSIASTGKKYDRFLTDFDKADMKTVAAEFRKAVEENGLTKYAETKSIGTSKENKFLKAVTSIPDKMISSQVNLLTLCDVLDGKDPSGAAKENIYRPLKEAQDREIARQRDAVAAMKEIVNKNYPEKNQLGDYKKERIQIPGTDRFMTKDEILSMALNWGNEANKERVLKGFNLTEDQAGVIFKNLGRNDWQFAQDTWDHLNSYWPDIRALEERVNGVTPESVKPLAFSNEHGEFRGGYYPIAYDYEKSSDAYKNNQEKNELYKSLSTAKAHTDSGHTEARVSNVTRPVRLSTDVLFAHVANVIHDLEFREPVIDVSRFLAQKDTKAAIENAFGLDGYKTFGDHLKAVASDQGEALSPVEKFIRQARFGTSIATMGWKLSSALPFATGNMANSIWEVGPSRFMGMMAEFGRNPMEIKNFVQEKSERMRLRATLIDRDVADLAKNWQGKESAITHYAFQIHAFADEAFSIPMWHSVYQSNLAEFGEAKAINLADEAVTKTFAAGSKIDQVGAQRGSEFKKLTSAFFSYQSMIFNRFWASGKEAALEYRQGNVGTALSVMAKAAVFGFVLPALSENFWKESLRNSPQNAQDEEDRKKRIIARTIVQPFAPIWIGRDLAEFLAQKVSGEGHGSSVHMTPVEDALSSVIAPFGDAANIAFNSGKHFDRHFAEEVTRGTAVAFKYPQQINSMAWNFVDFMNNQGALTWRDIMNRRTKK